MDQKEKSSESNGYYKRFAPNSTICQKRSKIRLSHSQTQRTLIDNKVLDKLNEDIIKEENLAKHKPHVCEEPAYERDYSYLCPEDWVKKSSDQCWGVNYDGHCESLKYFQDYSDEEKREFELNCCVLWPKLKNISKKTKKRDTLRGSVKSLYYTPIDFTAFVIIFVSFYQQIEHKNLSSL
ncbi:conserved Plasmodium protein, unknown function [Plasmodium malariae]|uniref:CPW-WPC domain-containing protein n=1 Tax=Plasmodium malariae TaxID=5858 RepID=A0A1A8WU19_PLAMA|nr:conserved Plasmodium protein, unknown function [Plasmodium malariae]